MGTLIFSTVMPEMVTLAPAVKVLPERREEGAGDSFYFYKGDFLIPKVTFFQNPIRFCSDRY